MQELDRELFLSSRDRHPHHEAVTFVENHVALPGSPRPIFSTWSDQFVSLEDAEQHQRERDALWKEVDEEKERLFGLMEQVHKKLASQKGSEVSVDDTIDLRKSNWRQVMGEVQKTARRWKDRPDKQSKVTNFIDKVGKNTPGLESWFGLLPAGDYGSSICGVFKLVVGAASQYGKVEETVFEALAEVPTIMEDAGKFIDIYQPIPDQHLEKRTFDLFRAIIHMLTHVMQLFADNKLQKIAGTIMKQGSYKEELLSSIQEIKKRFKAVKQEAILCQGRMSRKIYDNSERALKTSQVFYELLLTSPAFRSQAQELADQYRDTSQKEIGGYDRVNIDYSVSSDEADEAGPKSISRNKQQYAISQGSKPIGRPAKAAEARKRLLRCLRYDPDAASQDITTFIHLSHQLDERAKARAAAMIRHEQFRNFIEKVNSPDCLLVNGHDDLSAADGISPLTAVTTELARVSTERGIEAGPVLVLSYFCAAHQSSPIIDPTAWEHSSPISMMASLTGQLVQQLSDRGMAPDISDLSETKWRKVESLNLESICRVFRKLTKSIPRGYIVMCIVDEISLYEIQLMQSETNLMMERLTQLATRQGDGQPVFKLLVTCQSQALGVSEYFAGHTLDLQEDIEEDDLAEWTISELH